ncbi:hypothetical protein ACTFBV_14745 [Aeromonas rivipollensis]
MKTIKGPAIFLAQFMGDKPPFDTLTGLADWAPASAFAACNCRRTRACSIWAGRRPARIIATR